MDTVCVNNQDKIDLVVSFLLLQRWFQKQLMNLDEFSVYQPPPNHAYLTGRDRPSRVQCVLHGYLTAISRSLFYMGIERPIKFGMSHMVKCMPSSIAVERGLVLQSGAVKRAAWPQVWNFAHSARPVLPRCIASRKA